MGDEMKRVVILISGRGSNMAAVLEAERAGSIAGHVVSVISNRQDAPGVALAMDRGVPTTVVDPRHFRDQSPLEFERALAAAVEALSPDLVVLAGFMRVLSVDLVTRYEGRMLNIHPALLPAFPGLHTHRRALAAGVKVHGCTVHFVTAQVDQGPIVAQAAIAVRDDDDEQSLAARVLVAEHRILVAAVRWFCADRLVVDGARVRVRNETIGTETLLVPELS
jgi:phosphoribosylglycinamide formyltransferase-1